MEQKVRAYIMSDIHKLEDYSDIEICCMTDNEDAVKLMDERIENSSIRDLKSFCRAIDKGTVNYMTHGCR